MCSDMSSPYPHLSIGESSLPDSPQDGFYTQEQNYGSGKRYNASIKSHIFITTHILQYFLKFCASDHFVPSPFPYKVSPMHIDSESPVRTGNDLE